MGFKCGIVGLPNVGKSTLFNALTRSTAAQAANYAFCTIDPNVGMVEVPDPRLNEIASIVNPQKNIPATMEFVDIAGLVAGASKGEGLGNQFLAHIREVDAIAHVVRAFEDKNISHVAERIDPRADIETIDTELILADMDTLQRAQQRLAKTAKSGDKKSQTLVALVEQILAHLDNGQAVRSMQLDADQRKEIRSLCLLTDKPLLYIANVSESGFTDNPHLDTVAQIAQQEGAQMVPICAAIEQEISELDEADAADFLSEMGLQEAGLNRVIRAGYSLLDLHTYFTAGPKELRAWTIPVGATAPQAAGVIHTDFERGFIRAETTSFSDFIACGGEQGAKEAGKLRLEGKEYVVNDGDILHFRFNV